ncbi:bifunctional indole-3-glycerol-phosphate synthase TrpC/phosphoribosylanthranilate isomerase TrpF [Kangiella koreensis]|uniref:Multifunctional fusion protein n=1 Tax=Kangiella koreensis (strain DSM 16069 / JCM 12317 / KCTC 12182 / SW-125) TaxID=523791 RepID=C7RCR4_KANKD|nr:bifunctional indole-3-glycerol-phosphate synthase TrpC/phosphoribosylanthranilate isomerase TrpF [Kangiella koreensis]ACV27056.1 Indole-3-glycerol-phosphate synthase., Phosphoribosylanthranilate isomerase [Kangiella koreensis DSM 16069]
MLNVLETILEHKRSVIGNTADYHDLEPSQRSFYDALSKPHYGFIMECKKASPSKGLIRAKFDLDQIVPVYDQYADAISVLTEERFFRGSFSNLQKVRKLTDKPLLCKDFILSPKQIRQARYFGADAVLLMLSVLNDKDYTICQEQAESLNMDVLTEVHTEAELERAIKLGAKIIGINNRNLKDLSTSFEHTQALAKKIPADRLVVTESGINTHQDVLDLSQFSDACLVGSSLMKEDDLELAARQLVYGDIKVCGVTQQSDADLLQELPASCVGVIFVPNSKRCVDSNIITSSKPLIGVFQDQSIDEVVSAAQQYRLQAVQLHGDESLDFAQAIKQQVTDIKVSKVFHVGPEISSEIFEKELKTLLDTYDEVLLDTEVTNSTQNQRGGTGVSFDWSLLRNLNPQLFSQKLRIAGGVNAENIQNLKQLGVINVDLSSSVESSPGVKGKDLLAYFFRAARPQSGRNQFNSADREVDNNLNPVAVGGISS